MFSTCYVLVNMFLFYILKICVAFWWYVQDLDDVFMEFWWFSFRFHDVLIMVAFSLEFNEFGDVLWYFNDWTDVCMRFYDFGNVFMKMSWFCGVIMIFPWFGWRFHCFLMILVGFTWYFEDSGVHGVSLWVFLGPLGMPRGCSRSAFSW